MLFRDKKTGEIIDVNESLLQDKNLLKFVLSCFYSLEKEKLRPYIFRLLYSTSVAGRIRR